MYRHRPPQPGSQPYSSGPRPPRPSHQHQGPAPNTMGPSMNFQFPRPTQLPKELESALALQGSRDVDHRTMDHRNRPNPHQDSGIGQGFRTNPMTSDNRTDQNQSVDWSKYHPPNKLFAGPPPSSGQENENRAPVTNDSNWGGLANETQRRNVAADGLGLYTSESAGSILASFGLSNEDLEVLSHYPDDQLTPDTLPFILRDIQIHKASPKTSTSTALSALSTAVSDTKQDSTLPSPVGHLNQDIPSYLTVTQTTGKVIDYGHASRAEEDNKTRTTFKREQLSGERVVKILPSSSPSRKVDKPELRLDHMERGDKDYRRLSATDRKSSRSPGVEFPSKARNLDRDYRRERPGPRTSTETKSESSSSKSTLSSTTCVKTHNFSKKMPSAAMIRDFSAQTPKAFPYTCSLCHMQCDQEKDWDEHLNTVNHTAARRELRGKYPQWQPYSSRSDSTHYERYTSHSSCSRSRSRSPVYRPPQSKYLQRPHYHKSYTSSHHQTVRRPYNNYTKHTNIHDEAAAKHGPSAPFKRCSSPEPMEIGTARCGTSKPPPAKKKKKKKLVGQFGKPSDVTVAKTSAEEVPKISCLLYLTGIPLDATEEEVTDLVGSYGFINNVILLPCTEDERQRGEGQKASVCMGRPQDASALAMSTTLFIREKLITVTLPELPEDESPLKNSSKPAQEQGSDQGADPDTRKALLLITGLPESDWSQSNIEELIQPFGKPSDIIVAKTLGKVLLSVPDSETAEEIERFHKVMPAKILNTEIKILHLKPHRPLIGLKTPVALYNLLMGRRNPALDGPIEVRWSRLLVISNVPAPSGHIEVEKLVRRFGTVIRTLPLNNVVICEMASAKMAESVNRRFMKFPCILQNKLLSFSRCPDPKNTTEILEEKKTSKTTPVKKKIDPVIKVVESEVNGENETRKDDTNLDEMMEEVEQVSSDDLTPLEKETEVKDNPPVPSDSSEAQIPPSDAETPPCGEQPNTQAETREEDKAEGTTEKNMFDNQEEIQCDVNEELKEVELKNEENPPAVKEVKKSMSIKDEVKEKETKRLKDARDRERKERESKERRAKEREAREKERWKRTVERYQEEKERKEKRDKEKREFYRKEKERQERKRTYEDHRRSSRHIRRDEDSSIRRSSRREDEEENQEEDFPLDLGDFVTVDEVGEVGEEDLSECFPPFPLKTSDAEGVQKEDALTLETSDQPADAVEAQQSTSSTHSTECLSPLVSSSSTDPQSEPLRTEAAQAEALHSEAPQAETPHAEALQPEAPQAETPQAEALQAEAPQAEALQAEAPQTETPQAEALQAEAPQAETPQAETPQAETLQADTPKAEALQAETPQAETPQAETLQADTPKAEAIQVRTPQAESPHAETPQAEKSEGETPQADPLQAKAPQAETPRDEPSQDESSNSLKENSTSDLTHNEEQLPVPPQVEPCDQTTDSPDSAETPKRGQEDVEMTEGKSQTNATESYTGEAQSVTLPENKTTTEESPPINLTSLLPYNPSTAVGLEFLVPKTGFFCKPCNRFFTGNREFEITHCKSLKHYQNLQVFLKHMTPS